MIEKKEPTDTVILSVKLASGRFETSLRVPLIDDPDNMKRALERWVEMVRMGLATGATKIDAEFPNKGGEQ